MSTGTDAEQIYSIFHNQATDASGKYNAADWAWVADSNGTSYSDRITVNTTPLKQQFIDYQSAYLAVPMTIKSSSEATGSTRVLEAPVLNGQNTAVAPFVAYTGQYIDPTVMYPIFRDSVLSLISGLILQTDSGQVLINESGRLSFINNIRLKVEHSIDWVDSNGALLHFALDTAPAAASTIGTATQLYSNSDINEFGYSREASTTTALRFPASATSAAPGLVTATTTSTAHIPYRNPAYNAGALKRVQFMINSITTGERTSTSGTIYCTTAKIPLRLLHDLFEQMDFPVFNVGFNFTFMLAQANGDTNSSPSLNQHTPLMLAGPGVGTAAATSTVLGRGAVTTTLLSAGVKAPCILYGNAPGAISANACRLYYRTVKFSPADNARISEQMQKGFTKKIKFLSTDYNQVNSSTFPPTSGLCLITNSVVAPMRVWALCYADKGAGNSPWGGVLQGGIGGAVGDACVCSTQTVQNGFKNTNILINNQPYFKLAYQTADDFWVALRDQFNRNTGSMLKYTDFVAGGFRYHCFDISRLSDRLSSITEAVSLSIQTDWINTIPCDTLFLIERLNQLSFHFSSSDVNIVLGNPSV